MKTNKLARIIAIPALAGAALLNGCSSDTGFALDVLKIKMGHQQALYKKDDNRVESDKVIFKTDTQPYDKSEVTNQLVESPVWRHYKNRNQTE